MSKALVLLTLLTLTSAALAVGLWFSQPPDLTGKVTQLESELRDAHATIAKLKRAALASSDEGRGRASSANVTPVSVNGSATRGATNEAPSPGFASGPGFTPLGAAIPTAPLLPASAAPAAAPAIAAATPQDSRTVKKMAEAEARYAGLINQFNLAPPEKEYFKQLAASRSEVVRQAALKLQDPELSPAERQAIYASTKTQMDQSDSSIRQFLNNDSDFARFLEWDQTDIERNQVETGRAIFENNQVPLSSDQEDWLVKSLNSMRKDTTRGLADPYDLRSLAGIKVDRTYINKILSKFDQDSNVLLQNARSRFSQTQMEALSAFRKQMRVQTESRLWNMARTTNN